jgi:flagellar hook-associated protein 3 FlgL
MIGRVTHQTVQKSSLANLQLNLSKMADLQGRMSSGKVITKPSDDPGGTAHALQLRGEKRAAEQYARNIDNGVGWLSSVDSALLTSLASMRQARDLTVQGANIGTMNPVTREAIATELEGIRDTLLAQANTSYLGRSVFAGTSDAAAAFTGTAGVPPYTHSGTTGATVERRIAEDTTVRVDADGAAIFGVGAWDAGGAGTGGSVFGLIDQIASELRAGGDVSGRLADLDSRMNVMLGQVADVGTRYGALKAARSANEKTVMDLKGEISAVEDIDLAEVIVELQTQEVAYQAALGATSRVLQPSLMDFLR